jgi:SAM-dependent methyltransferase
MPGGQARLKETNSLQAELFDAFRTSGPEGVVEFVRWLAESSGLPARPRVLDIGCGTGRLLAPYAALGWRVTGMEPDTDFLARARQSAEGLTDVRLRKGGFGAIDARGTFDMVTAVDGPFAYLLTGGDRADALRRCHRALAPRGVLLLDVPNFLWILRNYRAPTPLVGMLHGSQVTLTRRHEVDYDRAIFRTVDEYVLDAVQGGGSRLSKSHDYAMTSPPELRHLLADAGFVDIRSYNGYDARRAEPLKEGGRILLSARKPGRATPGKRRP